MDFPLAESDCGLGTSYFGTLCSGDGMNECIFSLAFSLDGFVSRGPSLFLTSACILYVNNPAVCVITKVCASGSPDTEK